MNKKAFTIVELVIVIAVIAILAAVLIPTFSGIVRKANVSSDVQIVRNMNTNLTTESTYYGRPLTMHDALAMSGTTADKLKVSATGNAILWDSVNNVFCYLNDGEIEYYPDDDYTAPAKSKIWMVVDTVDSACEFSQYLRNNNLTGDVLVTNGGFDAGENKSITKVTYSNANSFNDVTLRVSCDDVNIYAPSGDVNYYGTCKTMTILEAAPSSVHIKQGVVGKLVVKTGHVEIESGARVVYLEVESNATVTVDNGAKVDVCYDPSGKVTGEVDLKLDASANVTIEEGTDGTITVKVGDKTFKISADGNVDTHEHTAGGSWSSDENQHWKTCTNENCGEKVGTENHTWNDGNTTKQATCVAKGEKTYTCTTCGKTKVEEIEIDSNGHDLEVVAKVDSTTEDFGTLAHDHCTLCGKNFIDGVEKTDDELQIAKKTGPSGTPIYNTSASANANSGVVFTNLSSDKDYYLAEDITLTGGSSSDVEIEASNINIDLNGKKISMSSSGADLAFKGANVKISNGTISSSNMRLYPKNTGFELDGVTVNNSSKDGIKFDYSSKDYVATIRNCNITGSATSGTRGAIVITNGTLNIYDSTLKANNPSSGATTVVVYPYANASGAKAIININNGCVLSGKIAFYNTGNYIINISGGSLSCDQLLPTGVNVNNLNNRLYITGGSFNFDPTNYVPNAGYKIAKTDSIWSVSTN